MGERGPTSSIVGHKCQRALDAALDAGASPAVVAKKFGFSPNAVARYRSARLREARKAPTQVREVPAPPVDASPLEHAKWHCERIDARIKATESATVVNAKELAGLYGQYTNASRHKDRLSGALDVTEAQVVRSVPWSRLMHLMSELLEKENPALLKRIADAVSAFAEGKPTR